MRLEDASSADEEAVAAQLGRVPRGTVGVAWRCPCGNPGVVATAPRLPDGTPFPTTFYLTCPRATAAVSTLEADQRMVEMTQRLAADEALRARYEAAHEAYLAARAEVGEAAGVGEVPEIAGISAGGMPTRVKCLHALAGHALAAGEGVNPLGDEAVDAIGEFWARPCLAPKGETTMTVAAIDCGTNSLRLLIASADGTGGLVEHDRRLELTRLGQGVDATRRFDPEALQRTLDALAGYAEAIRAAGCERVRFVATSAARDAENSAEFFDGVRERLGIEAEIIPGAEEAALSFRGARSGVPDAVDPVLVFDIGGGSTELVNGVGETIQHAVSIDMGSVRLRERYLHDDPPLPAQVAAARMFVDEQLDASGVDFAHVETCIGVAGTVTTLAGADLELQSYDRTRVHGHHMTDADVARLADLLLTTSVADVMTRFPSIPAKRAEVICAGALICERILARVAGDTMVVSEADILDGLAMGLLES